MNRDTLTGIIGAVILVAAMIGVFTYERSQAADLLGSEVFDVAWAEGSTGGPATTGNTPLGGTTEALLNVSTPHVTQASFTLTWTATNGEDTLVLHVVPPPSVGAQQVSSDPSSSGSITVTVDVPNPEPTSTSVSGDSETDAQERLRNAASNSAGLGEWQIVVEFTDATGLTPVAGAPPLAADQDVDWALDTSLAGWVPTLTAR